MPRVVVYLRFARPREGTKDPPLVQWNSEREQELWKMLRTSSSELDWSALAKHFNVSLVYILQQAAWLYEKELGLLRHRMSQINLPPSSSSPNQTQLQRLMYESSMEPRDADAILAAGGSPAESTTFDDFDESGSDLTPAAPSRRLLSTSRIMPTVADSTSESESDTSLDGFLPATRQASRTVSELSSSFSDNSVSQSALEEALIERANERRRSEEQAEESPSGSTQSTL